MKFLILISILTYSFMTNASVEILNKEISVLVTAGKLVETTKNENKKVKTPMDTIIDLSFEPNGELLKAEGSVALNGDTLEPGAGLISLQTAAYKLKDAGRDLKGNWTLEKSFVYGWVYEFAGTEKNKNMFYTLDAKTGKVLRAETY